MSTFVYFNTNTILPASQEFENFYRNIAEAYLEKHNLKADEVIVDFTPGYTRLEERPGSTELLGTIKPGDTVVTISVKDMFGRSSDAMEFFSYCEKNSIGFHVILMGGNVVAESFPKLGYTAMAAFAEQEHSFFHEQAKAA